MRFLPCGARALLVEFDSLADVLAHHRAWAGLDGVDELVPAARTLLVRTPDPEVTRARLLDAPAAPPGERVDGELVEIPVRYDGEDLEWVARHTGLGVDGVIEAHTGTDWTVGFTGFAPGFAYLTDGDLRLEVPRRPSPRTRVPAGAVGLAGTFSGVYPRSSPGGWQLIGRTTVVLFDPHAARPALLRPGMRVRFVPVDRLPEAAPAPVPPRREARRRLTLVESSGPVLVQDLGRPGLAELGVGPSGAADRASFAAGERLVGNHRAAALELGPGTATLRAVGAQTCALTGAPRQARAGGRVVGLGRVFAVGDGEALELGPATDGLRTHLHVRGGIDVEPVLGSRATDTLSGLGPAPLHTGDDVPLGDPAPGWWPTADWLPQPDWAEAVLEFHPGPRADWVAPLAGTTWWASAAQDRVGVRLEGEPLARLVEGELASEGVVAGAIQVPPDGQPVVFLADHPLTGGYPVAGVLTEASLARAAQLPPGTPVRLESTLALG